MLCLKLIAFISTVPSFCSTRNRIIALWCYSVCSSCLWPTRDHAKLRESLYPSLVSSIMHTNPCELLLVFSNRRESVQNGESDPASLSPWLSMSVERTRCEKWLTFYVHPPLSLSPTHHSITTIVPSLSVSSRLPSLFFPFFVFLSIIFHCFIRPFRDYSPFLVVAAFLRAFRTEISHDACVFLFFIQKLIRWNTFRHVFAITSLLVVFW